MDWEKIIRVLVETTLESTVLCFIYLSCCRLLRIPGSHKIQYKYQAGADPDGKGRKIKKGFEVVIILMVLGINIAFQFLF